MRNLIEFSVSNILRDGRRVTIRAQRREDRAALQAALVRMSDGSLYRRFFGVRRDFTDAEGAYFLDIDFVNHVALVVVADAFDGEAIVGGGRYVVISPGRAEIAFAIVDDYQGCGLGEALMRNLAAIARESGIKELFAEVLAENAAMLRVFGKCGLLQTNTREGDVVHVTLSLA